MVWRNPHGHMHARIQGRTHKERSAVVTTISRSLQATSEKKNFFIRLFEKAFLCTSKKVFSDSLKNRTVFPHCFQNTSSCESREEENSCYRLKLFTARQKRRPVQLKVHVDHKCTWFK